jgi:hypothetical protein
MKLQNKTAITVAMTLAPPLPEAEAEAAFAATSNGLPPPPKASGLELSLRCASDVNTVATPLFTAVVGWKDGEASDVVGWAGAAVWEEDDVLVELVVARIADDDAISLDAIDDGDGAATVPFAPVDAAAASFPGTLLGHR